MAKNKEDFDPRDIPSKIKREVRQICGFGCVICRCPIYEYDHIEEYSIVGEHTVENLTLLCPNCHFKKGKHQITKEFIRQCKDDAKNRYLKTNQIQKSPYTIDIGSNQINSFKGGVIFDCENFGCLTMGFTDSLSLSGKFFDQDGVPVLEINDNELSIGSHVWDIDYSGSTLTFRYALRDIFLSIDINAEKNLIVVRGKYFLNEVPIQISEKGICLDGEPIVFGNHIQNSDAGLMIGGWRPIYETGEFVEGVLTGHIDGNVLVGRFPIFILNPTTVFNNCIDSCQIAIFITHDFLIELHQHNLTMRRK